MKPDPRMDIVKRLAVEAEDLVQRQRQLLELFEADAFGLEETRALLEQLEAGLNNFRCSLALLHQASRSASN
jgi:hypothetical protein